MVNFISYEYKYAYTNSYSVRPQALGTQIAHITNTFFWLLKHLQHWFYKTVLLVWTHTLTRLENLWLVLEAAPHVGIRVGRYHLYLLQYTSLTNTSV